MTGLNIGQLLNQMLQAFVQNFESQGEKMLPELRNNAEIAFKGILLRTSKIAELVAEKKLSKEQAKLLLNMEKMNLEEQLLTSEGASKILLQNSINAAIDVVRDAINKLVGWSIL